jgi:hypothetical protein
MIDKRPSFFDHRIAPNVSDDVPEPTHSCTGCNTWQPNQSYVAPDRIHTYCRLFSLVIAVLIFSMVSGLPEPTCNTRSIARRLTPIASAHSTPVWNVFLKSLKALYSSLVSRTLFRRGAAVSVSVVFIMFYICLTNVPHEYTSLKDAYPNKNDVFQNI